MSEQLTQEPEEREMGAHITLDTPPPVRIQVLEAKDLHRKKDNSRLHDKKNLGVIDDSVDEVGFWRSIAIDENNVTEAGNGTLEIAQRRGAKVIVIDVDDPNTLVAVRRSGIDTLKKHRYNLRDNRATDTSKNNKKAIARMAEENPAQLLLGGIFSPREQEKLLVAQANALELGDGGAGGGTAGAAPKSSGSTTSTVRPESGVRMVQLFMDTQSQPEFVRKVRTLSRLEELKPYMPPLVSSGQVQATMTDAIVAIVNYLHDLRVPKEAAGAPPEATAEPSATSEEGAVGMAGAGGPELFVAEPAPEAVMAEESEAPDVVTAETVDAEDFHAHLDGGELTRFEAAVAEDEEEAPGQKLARKVHQPGVVKD